MPTPTQVMELTLMSIAIRDSGGAARFDVHVKPRTQALEAHYLELEPFGYYVRNSALKNAP